MAAAGPKLFPPQEAGESRALSLFARVGDSYEINRQLCATIAVCSLALRSHTPAHLSSFHKKTLG